jgi:sugar phosphate isomerase/epimerase
MSQRVISVSTVAFDGYDFDVAFREITRLGIDVVEPAYIKGYMDFDETSFSDAAADAMRIKLATYGLSSVAISAHMDMGEADAAEMLARRIRFTAGIGGRFTITNSTSKERQSHFQTVIEKNLPLAAELGVTIALENPGHGATNLMRDGKSGAALVAAFQSPFLQLNYDVGNVLTCTEGQTRPETDILLALPKSCHVHLKDVFRRNARWAYGAIGSGEIDYNLVLGSLDAFPEIPLTIELPLRLRRMFDRDPVRLPELVAIEDIVAAIKTSWNFVDRKLYR